MGATMSCSRCGHTFEDFDAANQIDASGARVLPCPSCGSVNGRNASITLSDSAVVTADIASAVLTKGDLRPWAEKWLKLLDGLEELQNLYQRGGAGESSTRIERRFDDFFTTCFHLSDWLVNDAQVPYPDVDAYMKAEHPLALARAVSNTEKHHTRSSGITARIRSVELAGGVRATIEENWSRPNRRSHDALQIANDAVEAWRRFLVSRGLTPPA